MSTILEEFCEDVLEVNVKEIKHFEKILGENVRVICKDCEEIIDFDLKIRLDSNRLLMVINICDKCGR